MESGWFGGVLLGQDESGGDGRRLLWSWTSHEEGLNGNGKYQVMLAKVEFDTATRQPSATAPTIPSHTSTSPNPSASHGGKVNAGSSVCHGRIWSESWAFAWSATMLLVFVWLVSGSPC